MATAIEEEIVDLEKNIHSHLDEINEKNGLPFELSLSVGWAEFDAGQYSNMEELVSAADQAMYRQKAEKKRAKP